MSIHVLAPGLLTTVQDGGRTGFSALGVGQSGAMDSVSMRLANMLVGNAHDAAVLEITLLGPRLRLDTDSLIALTGSEIETHCSDRRIPAWRPVALRAGSELNFGSMRSGARAYLAVAGGIDVPSVLGSRSVDLNGGLGTRSLAAGDELGQGFAQPAVCRSLMRSLQPEAAPVLRIAAAKWSIDPGPWLDVDQRHRICLIRGAHFACLEADSQRSLFASEFRIDPDSNRVGYRLAGNRLALRETLELVSEGVVAGTVQLPPSGDPIVLMAEAPTCGGYPRIAQVISVDLPRLAQRRPGATLQFVETSLDDAQTRYLEREQALTRLENTIRQRLQNT
ncbi:MAG: biotin-dependent carboxyltransferase family protein [Rudaea sp.]